MGGQWGWGCPRLQDQDPRSHHRGDHSKYLILNCSPSNPWRKSSHGLLSTHVAMYALACASASSGSWGYRLIPLESSRPMWSLTCFSTFRQSSPRVCSQPLRTYTDCSFKITEARRTTSGDMLNMKYENSTCIPCTKA